MGVLEVLVLASTCLAMGVLLGVAVDYLNVLLDRIL